MNTMNLAERVFAVMRDLSPDDGWEWCDGHARVGFQIYAGWTRCELQPASDLSAELMRRATTYGDDRVTVTVECKLQREQLALGTMRRLWRVDVAIVVADVTVGEMMTSAAALVWQNSQAAREARP